MKPFAIVLTIVLGLASLSIVVWIGKFGGLAAKPATPAAKAPPTVDDLPMPASGPYGKVEIEETEFSFGVKMVGDEAEHSFAMKNIGEGLLKFKLGKPSCQCTVGEIRKMDGELIKEGPFPPGEECEMAPGESVKISVKWVMKSKLDKFRQTVPVFTTDPDKRQIEIAVSGIVDVPLHIRPDGVWELGEMLYTEPATAIGFIASAVLDEFTLTEEPREDAKAKVSWEPLDKNDATFKDLKSGYKVTVLVTPDVPIGHFRELIRFKATSGASEYPLEFTVSGHRSGPIDIRGVSDGGKFNINSNRLIFPDFPAASGKKVTMTLFVKKLEGELVLNSVEPADTRFKVKILEPGKAFGKSKSYKVEVEIPPGPGGKHRGEEAEVVYLKFNHPDAPDFKLLLDYNAFREGSAN